MENNLPGYLLLPVHTVFFEPCFVEFIRELTFLSQMGNNDALPSIEYVQNILTDNTGKGRNTNENLCYSLSVTYIGDVARIPDLLFKDMYMCICPSETETCLKWKTVMSLAILF